MKKEFILTEQEKIIAGMSPEKKLNLSLQLYYSARSLKRVALKKHYPDLSEDEIEKMLKEIFLYARS
ncbi:MAG TPA: hypothetical protein VLN45_07630 [Ignavibacteriaceae bacterium]|nr:hypothetical protein [Ignavibacteriaceae bacterium]